MPMFTSRFSARSIGKVEVPGNILVPKELVSVSNINAVTSSFAASLALASSDVIDVSHTSGGIQRLAKQSFLLARPLVKKPVALNDLKRFLRRVWVLDMDFKIQERAPDRFVLAFDLRKDRNKVLKGGPRRFHQAPIVFQEYDGVAPIEDIALTLLFFWVRINNIPPLFEEPDMIRNIASVAGKFLELDDKLFANQGKVPVHVAHDISKPFFLKKTLRLASGVEAEISYFFENLVGKCDHCNLIYHEGDHCPLLGRHTTPHTGDQRKDIVGPSLGFAANKFVDGTFRFQGVQTPILPNICRSLFQPKEASKPHKPIILRARDLTLSESDEEVHQPLTLAVIAAPSNHVPNSESTTLDECLELEKVSPSEPTESTQSLKTSENTGIPAVVEAVVKENRGDKRQLPSSPTKSPQKLKFLLPELFKPLIPEVQAKKQKMPMFSSRFSARSIGMVEVPGNILVPKELVSAHSEAKKKRGRPLGAKNKNPPKSKKVTDAQETCFAYLSKPPSPTVKGKEQI